MFRAAYTLCAAATLTVCGGAQTCYIHYINHTLQLQNIYNFSSLSSFRLEILTIIIMQASAPATLPDVDCELPPAALAGVRPRPHVGHGPVRGVGPVVVAAAVPPPLRAAHSREQPGISDAEDYILNMRGRTQIT